MTNEERIPKVGLAVPVVPMPGVLTAIEPYCCAERCPGRAFGIDRQGCTACRIYQVYCAGWGAGVLFERGELE